MSESASNTRTMASMTVQGMKDFLEAFNRHDVEAIMAFMADDAVYETPSGADAHGKRMAGREAIAAYFTKMFQNMPDTHFGDDSHWMQGETGVSEWTLSGTLTDGSRMEVRGCDLFRFRDGLIVRKDSFLKARQ